MKKEKSTVGLLSTEILVPRLVRICYERPMLNEMVKVCCSNDAADFIQETFPRVQLMYREYFWVICLNRANCVLGVSLIGKGDDGSVVVSVKEILQLGILSHASALILMHNHPSGTLKPSSSDLHLTQEVKKALAYTKISLHDHIILTHESHYSMANEGHL